MVLIEIIFWTMTVIGLSCFGIFFLNLIRKKFGFNKQNTEEEK